MEGYDAPYLPGWDCHGLPIEIKVVGEKAADMDLLKVRRECREYAKNSLRFRKRSSSDSVFLESGTLLT